MFKVSVYDVIHRSTDNAMVVNSRVETMNESDLTSWFSSRAVNQVLNHGYFAKCDTLNILGDEYTLFSQTIIIRTK